MPFKHKIIIFVLSLVVLAVVYYAWTTLGSRSVVKEETKEIFATTGDEAVFVDKSGQSVSFDKYFGQIMVVTTWASWSPSTKVELEKFQALASDFANQPVVFIALGRDQDRTQAQRFLDSIPDLPAVEVIIDQADQFNAKVEGFAMPETVLFDKNGDIILRLYGDNKQAEISQKLDELFAR